MRLCENKMVAVAVCTKRLGLVVFCQAELIYFAVKTLKPPRTIPQIQHQVSEIIQEIIAEFTPEEVVLKLPGKQQAKSKNLLTAVNQIKQEAQAAGILWQEISFEQVKREFCLDGKPNKTNVFKTIVRNYPELKQFVNHPSRWQTEYYNSLLSAAAVGFYILNKSSNKNSSKQN